MTSSIRVLTMLGYVCGFVGLFTYGRLSGDETIARAAGLFLAAAAGGAAIEAVRLIYIRAGRGA